MDDSKERPSNQTDTSWQDDQILKKVAVVVRTPNCILDGYTYCLKQQRLLDSFNNGFVTNIKKVGTDFLPLADVKVSLSNEKNGVFIIYLHKKNKHPVYR